MSTRESLSGYMDVQSQRCFACNEEDWTGFWHGLVEVFVCRRCATEVLPRLIADAVWRGHVQYDKIAALEHDLERIRAEFWRATAINATRKPAQETEAERQER